MIIAFCSMNLFLRIDLSDLLFRCMVVEERRGVTGTLSSYQFVITDRRPATKWLPSQYQCPRVEAGQCLGA